MVFGYPVAGLRIGHEFAAPRKAREITGSFTLNEYDPELLRWAFFGAAQP